MPLKCSDPHIPCLDQIDTFYRSCRGDPTSPVIQYGCGGIERFLELLAQMVSDNRRCVVWQFWMRPLQSMPVASHESFCLRRKPNVEFGLDVNYRFDTVYPKAGGNPLGSQAALLLHMVRLWEPQTIRDLQCLYQGHGANLPWCHETASRKWRNTILIADTLATTQETDKPGVQVAIAVPDINLTRDQTIT
jgi:hypothetical protein